MIDPITKWLAQLGLERYAEIFAAADVDVDTLPFLTEPDLEKLGVTLGHRKRIVNAILAQPVAAAATASSNAKAEGKPSPHAGERRQLTIFFCDLVGSTAIAATLDPEDVRSLMSGFHDLCAEVVAAHAGTVAQYLGDGVMVEFGYPLAREDDAERAVRCALALIETVREKEFSGGMRLQTRVGIATGTEVVGNVRTATLGRGSSVGSTPSLAARIQNVAGTNCAVIASSTRRLLGDIFQLESLGKHALKGFEADIELWRVEGERRGASRFAARSGGASTRFVGREHESALLDHRLSLATGGEGQAVLLVAEPGVGKSRIAEQLLTRFAGTETRVLRMQCSPHRTATAFYPVAEYVTHAAGIAQSDTTEQRMEKLARYTEDGNAESTALDAFALLLGLPGAVERPNLRTLDLEQRKALVFHSVVDRLSELAANGTAIVLIEDLHWADPTSLDLITRIIEAAESRRLLIIVTARPTFESPPAWRQFGHITTVVINRLERRAVAAIVSELCGGKALPDSVLDQIVEHTDGVPLFVEELTKSVLESTVLAEESDRYTMTGTFSAASIPATLRDALAARLDTQGMVREIAQAGAVVGREFSFAMVAAISGADDATLREALEALVASGLVLRRTAPGSVEFSFKHALVRDAAYDTLLRARRQTLHLEVARAMTSQFASRGEHEPEVVAHHLEEGGNREGAIPYWRSAADAAIARNAYREAATQLRRGIALVPSIASNGVETELELQNKLGTVCFVLEGGGSRNARATFERAWLLAAPMPECRTTFVALFGLCLSNLMSGNFRASGAMATQLVALADALADDDLMLEALHASWASSLAIGDVANAVSATTRAVSIYDVERHHRHVTDFGGGHDSGVCCRGQGAIALILCGRIEEGRVWLRECDLLLERLEHPFTRCVGTQFMSQAYHLLGEFEPALAHGTKCLERARDRNFLMPLDFGELLVGASLVGLGERERGIGLIADVFAKPDVAVPASWRAAHLAWLASAEIDVGYDLAAAAHLEQARTTAASLGGCFAAGEIDRIEAKLARSRDATWETIDAHLERAIVTSRSDGARFLELRALTDRLELFRSSRPGDDGEVCDALRAALASIDGNPSDVRRARALLEASHLVPGV